MVNQLLSVAEFQTEELKQKLESLEESSLRAFSMDTPGATDSVYQFEGLNIVGINLGHILS